MRRSPFSPLSLLLSACMAGFSLRPALAAEDPFYPSPANLDTSRLIMPKDLQYQGAFRMSKSASGSQYGLTYLIGAMTWNPRGDVNGPSDGYPGSLFIAGHTSEKKVAEIDIPAPLKSKNYDELPAARILTPFAALGTPPPSSGINVMDVTYLERQGSQTSDKLHVTLGDGYLPTGTPRTYSTADLNFGNQTSSRAFVSDKVHCYNDYLFAVPESWSSRYAPGMALAGGRHREGNLCGEGPALFLMAPWNDPLSSTVATKPILRYLDNGGALNSYSRGGDLYFAGQWLESGRKSAVIFSGRKGLGRPDYGTFCGVQGFHDLNGYRPYIIFYDPETLGQVANGTLEAHKPQPYAAININDLLMYPNTDACKRHHLNDFAWDATRKVLYATERSKGEFPVVHVWKVADGSGSTPPSTDPPPVNPCQG